MEEQEFRKIVAEALANLSRQVDALETDDIDPSFTDGVLTVSFESGGTFVLSQQVPARELWLSANRHAWHFRYGGGAWAERDSGEAMLPLLSRLFSEKLKMTVVFT